MAVLETASLAIHVLVGALWVGAVVFTVAVVLPLARDGELNAAPLEAVAASLRRYSRASAVLLLLTGGHLLWARGYLDGALFASGRGHLVVTMAGLWLVTTGLVEVGTGKLLDGTAGRKVREPARDADRLLKAAAVTGALVLVDAAALIGYAWA